MNDTNAEATAGGGARSMPLTLAMPGQQLELVGISGGRRFQHRMAEMGLVPGVRFSVVVRGSPGPFIVELKQARLVVGRGTTHRLYVRAV